VIRPIAGGVIIDVRVMPRASKSEVSGTRGDAVVVRLKTPPVDGAANAELIEILASRLQVSRRAVAMVTGETSRRKRVKVMGLDVATAEARLTGQRT
jgi:uncharacterized protein (TIGR00251 family)